MKRTIKIESDTIPGTHYTVTLDNGVSVDCSCPGFVGAGYCKHLERGDLHDSFKKAKKAIKENEGIDEETFWRRYRLTIKKFEDEKEKNPVTAAIRRVISKSKQYKVKCLRCSGTGVLTMYSHIENGVCFRCLGDGIEP